MDLRQFKFPCRPMNPSGLEFGLSKQCSEHEEVVCTPGTNRRALEVAQVRQATLKALKMEETVHLSTQNGAAQMSVTCG